MFKSLKRAVATLATLALMVSNTGLAFAQTFNDVPTDAWYFDYVEQLVDEGVFDIADTFRPNDHLNRAELVKIVITAMDGLADYEAPATPTFDDVAIDDWYYEYVEAAVQLGVVSGYTDASGNLTGMFGPADTVNRAAATKILVNGFAVPTTLNPGSMFPDVKEGSWFYDYVITAYNMSILDGYSNGNFGPADPVTRAQVAKLTVNAQDPVLRTSVVEDVNDEDPIAMGEGALELSLNDDTPPSSTIPQSATSVELLAVDFTAADDDVNVTNLVVTRGGVGQTTDWEGLYVYDGVKRLTTARSINSDTNTTTFSFNVMVDAGTTKTLRVVGDSSATPLASNQHYFYVASAADLTSNAQSVAGDFPVAGNTFTMGSVLVTSLTISAGSEPSQPVVGANDVEIAAFKLAAGADNDVALHQVTFTQNGSLSSSKMVNLRLLRGSDEVASATGFDGDLVSFVLDTPYVIDKGQTKNFYVRADLDGGRPNDDTIQLYLDEKTDLVGIDQQYGYGTTVTNNYATGNSAAITLKGGKVTVADNGPASRQIAQNTTNVALLDFSITTDRDIDVKDMDLFVMAGIGGDYPDVPAAEDSTAYNMVVAGAGNNNLKTGFRTDFDANGAGTAIGDLLELGDIFSVALGGTTYYCTVTNTVANTATNDVTSDCPSVSAAAADLTVGIDPYKWIENVRIVDIDSGATLQGPVTRWNATTTPSAVTPTTNLTYSKKMSEDYSLIAGDTRHLRVEADFNQNMPSGLEVQAKIKYDTAAGYLKDVDANKNVPTADIVGGELTGKKMTVKQNSLTVAKTSNIISREHVKGSNGVEAFQIALQAGDAGDITVKKLILRVYADDGNGANAFDSFADGGAATGDKEAKKYVSSVSLYDGDTLVAGPVSLELVGGTVFTANTAGVYNKALFENFNLVVPKGQTKDLTAKLNLLNNTGSSTVFLALDIDPASDITAEDEDANTVTASTGNLNLLPAPNPMITMIGSGSLSADVTGSYSPEVYVGGTDNLLVAQYKFTAEKESYTVNTLTVLNDTDGNRTTAEETNVIENVVLVYTNINGTEQTRSGSLTAGKSVKFSDLGFYVPQEGGATLKIYADTKAIDTQFFSLSGKKFLLALKEGNLGSTEFEAIGVSSSEATYFTAAADITGAANLARHILRRSKPVFTHLPPASSPGVLSSTSNLYQFSVTANGGDVTLGRLVFDITQSWAGAGAVSSFKFQSSDTSLATVSDVNGVNIYSDAGVDLKTTTALGAGVKAIVTFDQQQVIANGNTNYYVLKANISGSVKDDSIETQFASGDETTEVSGILAGYDNENGLFANTSYLSDAVANQGLFLDTGATTSYLRGIAGIYAARNIVWSDQSGSDSCGVVSASCPFATGTATSKSHVFPTIATGVVTANSGTADWTNGYLLNVEQLNPTSLKAL